MSWETDLLEQLGARATPPNIAFLDAWAQEEGANSYFNPLNITGTSCSSYGAVGCFNSDNVLEFPNWATGIKATATYMSLPGFDGALVAAFQSGNALQYFQNNPAAASQLRSAWSYGVGGIAKNMGAKYTPMTGAQNTAPSVGGWQNLPQDIVQGIEGIGAGILGGIESFLNPLFSGMVSPFLRLPQSLINIGWNLGGFAIGCLLILVSGVLLFGAVFEEGFSTMSDKSDDMIAAVKTFAPKAAEAVVLE